MPEPAQAEIEEEASPVPAAPAGGGNTWPSEADEAAFLAEQRVQGENATAVSAGENSAESPLPSLDELVPRIPAEVRAALDNLFRAKFVAVRRVPEKVLKS